MAFGEDFGYLKNTEQKYIVVIARRAFLLGAILLSIVCFIYITINAYYFSHQDKNNGIKVIKSPVSSIKIINQNDGLVIKNIDKAIYDNIVGSRHLLKEDFNNVVVVEQVVTPSAKKDQVIRGVDKKHNSEIIISNKDNKFVESSGDIMVYSDKKNEVQSMSLSNNKFKKSKEIIRGVARVQVAALSTKDSALRYWSKLSKLHPNLFTNLNYFISEVNLGQKGNFHRLQIGNFRDQVEAENFCYRFISQLGKSKADCIIVE